VPRMPIHITHETVADAPVDQVFAYVADYRNAGHWLSGVKSFTPVGDLDYGLHSVFDAALSVGVTTLHSTVKVIDFIEGEAMELDSIKGFKNQSRWSFTADGADRTRIDAEITYELPGGVAGRAMGKVLEPLIALVIKHSADNLAKHF
jgi:uncharacterized membrane protein